MSGVQELLLSSQQFCRLGRGIVHGARIPSFGRVVGGEEPFVKVVELVRGGKPYCQG